MIEPPTTFRGRVYQIVAIVLRLFAASASADFILDAIDKQTAEHSGK